MHRCTNTHTRSWHGNTLVQPADFLVRTLISVVVTSEGCYSTARHLDTHGIFHYCVSESVCVCVRVRVHARCALGVGGRCHRRQYLLRVKLISFSWMDHKFRCLWRCCMSSLTYMIQNTHACMYVPHTSTQTTCVHCKIHAFTWENEVICDHANSRQPLRGSGGLLGLISN